ncbi:endonuclease III domain-containing protein [Gammaproteobacteria bacterium]|nr:endonuclease III domain-containing protein [Gammaproteobacteria bacterium]
MIPLLAIDELYRLLLKEYGPQHWWPAQSIFEIFAGAILTQNTAWRNVERALDNLKQAGALSPDQMLAMRPHALSELLRPSGCYNVKTRHLRAMCTWLVDNGLVDNGGYARLATLGTSDLRDSLLSVHGIGQETADVILVYAFERPVFVVDAYARRLFSRAGLIQGKESYQEIRGLVETQMTPDAADFNELHALIVEHAKQTCRKNPRCDACRAYRRCRYSIDKNEP